MSKNCTQEAHLLYYSLIYSYFSINTDFSINWTVLKTLCKCVWNGLNDSLLMHGLWIALLNVCFNGYVYQVHKYTKWHISTTLSFARRPDSDASNTFELKFSYQIHVSLTCSLSLAHKHTIKGLLFWCLHHWQTATLNYCCNH